MRSETYETTAVESTTVTIPINQTDSTAFRLGSSHFLALLFGTFTGATVSFKGATEETGTYTAIVDSAGAAVSAVATDDCWVSMKPEVMACLAPYAWLKLVSASAEGAARTITVQTKRG